jgi:F0F1-type ATP synthase assembly protein I
MSDKAYYISQIILVITLGLVVVSAAGFDVLQKFTLQAWIGSTMVLVATLTLVNAARMFRRVRH